MQLHVNGQRRAVDAAWREESLLFVLREHFGLVGTKLGCGRGECGACTVLIDGRAVRACSVAAVAAVDRQIETIEGLGTPDKPHPLQTAWLETSVPQCGYCQSGQIMTATALLRDTPSPTDVEIEAAMSSVWCRCGTYDRIRRAVRQAAEAQ